VERPLDRRRACDIRHNVRVSEILILARVRIHEFDLPIVADYYFEVSERLSTVQGSLGLSVWRDPRDPESFLVAYEYADLAAAERGLVALTEVRVLAETQAADFRPAHVLRVKVFDRSARRLSEAPQTACLSMSIRIADPGYSPELLDDLGRTFEDLQYIPGYIGSVYGTNDVLEEEVIGLVVWANREAYVKSLPPVHQVSDLTMYSRFY